MNPERPFDPQLLLIRDNLMKTFEMINFFEINLASKTALFPDTISGPVFKHFTSEGVEGDLNPDFKHLVVRLPNVKINEFKGMYVTLGDSEEGIKTLGILSALEKEPYALGLGYCFDQNGGFKYKFSSPEKEFDFFKLNSSDYEVLGTITSSLRSFLADFIEKQIGTFQTE